MADGILSGPVEAERHHGRRPSYPSVEARPGLVVEHRPSGTAGAVMDLSARGVILRDRHGRDHEFRLRDGAFAFEGTPCSLVAPRPGDAGIELTASGSVAVPDAPARVARASRIWVEGIHDAELIEHVWGDDLRVEGIVVEPLHGADDLPAAVRGFQARPGRRLGILLDHLVAGSKESRLAAQIDHPDVLVCGHPYVDIWEAIRPSVLGIDAWPQIPKGQDWKTGVCRALDVGEPKMLWRLILRSVSTYADLEADLVRSVEQLIDFVTVRT